MNKMLLVASNPPAGTDTDAAAWKTAVIANGGTVSDATLKAVSDFCKAAKANSYWSKLLRINLFCGTGLAACMVPLKVGGGYSVETNINFVSGDYSESTGLTGGVGKYLNTGINATIPTTNDCHLSVYNRSSSLSTAAHIGCQTSLAQRFLLLAPYDGVAYGNFYSLGEGGTSASISAPYGHVIASRTSASLNTLYRNGSSINTNTSTISGTAPNLNVFVFAMNSSGSPSFYAPSAMGGYSIGDGLSSTDAANYYTDLQAFQTALGRNV